MIHKKKTFPRSNWRMKYTIVNNTWNDGKYFVKLNMFELRKYWLECNCGIYDEKRGKDFQFFSETILISTLKFFGKTRKH